MVFQYFCPGLSENLKFMLDLHQIQLIKVPTTVHLNIQDFLQFNYSLLALLLPQK